MPAYAPRELVGRERELLQLERQLSALSEGSASVTVLQGPPGLGKTRLLQQATLAARRAGVRFGIGAAQETERLVPMAALLEALFGSAEPLLDRDSLAGLSAVHEQRYWLLQELQSLLERASLASPMVICLDDLQWADPGTVAAVRALPERLAQSPIAWFFACRTGEASVELRSAFESLGQLGGEMVSLQEIDRDAVAALMGEMLGATPSKDLVSLARGANGSPFLVVELVAGLLEERLLEVAGGRAELLSAGLPRRLQDSMRQRLGRLSLAARRLVTVAAVMGRRSAFECLVLMMESSPSELLVPLEELLACNVLVQRGDELEFRHDLIREAVLETLPVAARHALQRQSADVLLASGAPPVEVALQVAASSKPGDQRAIGILREAADQLRASDPDAAASLSRRAFELARSSDPLRGQLAAETAIALHAAGRVAEGQAFADEALRDILPAEDEAKVLLSLAGMLSLAPDVRGSMGAHALALPDISAEVRARHLAALAHNRIAAGRMAEAREVLDIAREVVDEHGDATARFTLEMARAAFEYTNGRFAAAQEILLAGMRQRHGTQDEARVRLSEQWRSEVLVALDDESEALRVSVESLVNAQRDRQAWAVRWFESSRGRQLFQFGHLHDAAASLKGLLAFDPDSDGVSVVDVAGLVALSRVATHIGDIGLMVQTGKLVQPILGASEPNLQRHAAWLLAMQLMANSDAEAARATLLHVASADGEGVMPVYPVDVADPPQLVRIAMAAGDKEMAAITTAVADDRAHANPRVPALLGIAAHARGLLLGDASELDTAVRFLEQSARPLAMTSAVEDRGRLAVAAGDRRIAVESFHRALASFSALGATWDAARVRSRLRGLGVRTRVQSSRQPQSAWAGLTESELAVIRLVARGLTNREVAERLFVSPHTVGQHLRHVFAKLGITSRVELARLELTQLP